MGLKEKIALGAGKLAGGAKNVASGAYNAANSAAHNAKGRYQDYQEKQELKASLNRQKADDAKFADLQRRYSRLPQGESSNLEQHYRDELAKANLRDEQTKARELKASRKRVRNMETQASLDRRVNKLNNRQGRAPTGPSNIGNTGGVMDVLEGRAGPGQGLSDVDKRLRGFF